MFKHFLYFLFSLLILSSPLFSQIMFTAELDGAQEAPTPVTTNGTGTAWAVLSADLSSLSYQVTYAQLDSNFTASHFHIGAAGTSGGVIFPITTFSGNTASGSWDNIPDSIVAKLIKGELYINVHSIAHPGGEIRGQLYPVSGIGFTVSLDGNQVTPTPVTTNASGTGWVVLDNNGTEINHSLTVAGLSSNLTAAHFHNAPIGTSGGVVHPIAFSDSTSTGSWTGFADNMISELLKNNLYLNVHTVNFPAGEIRGQVILRSDIMLNASLDGNQEAPTPVTTNATGTAWAVLSADLSSLSYQVTYAQLDSTFTASHFHIGAAGTSGGVIFPITTFSGNTASGSWDNIPDSIVAKLLKGELYINVHSIAHPGGEIRGQLYPVSGIGFTVSLDGNQVTPTPVTTNASGTGWVVLDNNGTEINHSLTAAGLSSNLTAAHFHNAPAGTGGGVVHPIAFTDSTSTGSWTGFADNMISELLKNNLYLNVHTVNFPAGEIRGQVLFSNITSGNVPVELTSFTASISGKLVNLIWRTATETNNLGFDIERRTDRNSFAKIGFISGKGTSLETQSYKFVDSDELNGTYYYRLKQIDFDGSFEYSPVIQVQMGEGPSTFALDQNYPNPFNPSTVISFQLAQKTNVSLKIYNILGKEVAILLNESKDAGSYKINFNSSSVAGGLASGVYIYKLATSSGEIFTRKMTLLK